MEINVRHVIPLPSNLQLLFHARVKKMQMQVFSLTMDPLWIYISVFFRMDHIECSPPFDRTLHMSDHGPLDPRADREWQGAVCQGVTFFSLTSRSEPGGRFRWVHPSQDRIQFYLK